MKGLQITTNLTYSSDLELQKATENFLYFVEFHIEKYCITTHL
jgi:hypothetical protein